jgi:ABC-type transport system involved in multi-copper enzyme maturation permease subunit
MSPSAVWLVIAQEFRIRLRTGRWRWLIGGWVVLLAVFTFLLDIGLHTGYGYVPDDSLRGVPLFGFLMFFILGSMLVISPALTSQAINGDRERGTLATLQVTRLRPAEIAVGKLLAGWGVGLVALALSIPFAGYAMAQGGITIVRMLAVYGVVALLIGVVCAFSQALSALLARSITSALLSYVTAAALAVGTLIAFGIAVPLTEERKHVQLPDGSSFDEYRTHEDRVWWLLAPNPFVILADAAPRVPPKITRDGEEIRIDDYDPLSQISRQVRRLRVGPDYDYYYYGYVSVPCNDVVVGTPDNSQSLVACAAPPPPDLPVWPYGLAFSALLGVGSIAITTLRLRTPTRRLPKGVRVA